MKVTPAARKPVRPATKPLVFTPPPIPLGLRTDFSGHYLAKYTGQNDPAAKKVGDFLRHLSSHKDFQKLQAAISSEYCLSVCRHTRGELQNHFVIFLYKQNIYGVPNSGTVTVAKTKPFLAEAVDDKKRSRMTRQILSLIAPYQTVVVTP